MTTSGFVAIKHATYGGVYYTADFTLSGAITWAKLTTTGLSSLVITNFKVDPFNPINRQYVIADQVLYTRNGGDWSSIMDTTAALALTGALNIGTGPSITNAWPDPTVEGTIYCAYFSNSPTNLALFILKSVDYGANWTVKWSPPDAIGGGPYDMQVYGETIWITHDKNYPPNPVIDYTGDGGATYSRRNFSAFGGLMVNPHDTTECYAGPPGGVGVNPITRWDWGGSPEYTALQDDLGDVFYAANGRKGEVLWIDPATSDHQRMSRGQTILYTSDDWATYSTTTFTPAIGLTLPSQITSPQNTGSTTAVIIGRSAGSAGANRSSVYAFDTEADTVGDVRNGANSETTYVDSVPSNLLLADRTPIWVGEAPSSTGVYVYSVEMESDTGWTTDVTDYDKIGSPMGGDRSSFRDMPADGFDVYHAQDVHAGTPQIHAPWDEAAPPGAGYGIVSDGTKWKVSSDEIALVGDLHDAVTLDADAALILDLSTQEIGLDTQSANTVFAGPTTGAANEPTFRALVAADVGTGTPDGTKFLRDDMSWQDASPAMALDDLSDVSGTSGAATGSVLYKTSGDWTDYALGVGSAIQNNGTYIRIGAASSGYVEIDIATGELRLQGTATQYDDLRVSASIAKPGVTAPNYKTFGPSGNLQALMFEAGHHDEVYFEVQLPHNWREGSDIYPHVHWAPVNTTAGNVVWELEYTWANVDGTFGAPGNMATDATAAGGTAWVHKLTALKESGNSYISGTGKTLSSMLVCRLHRNSNSGSDTLNQDVALLEFDLHYEINSFGSFTEYGKSMNDLLLESGDNLLLEDGFDLGLE